MIECAIQILSCKQEQNFVAKNGGVPNIEDKSVNVTLNPSALLRVNSVKGLQRP